VSNLLNQTCEACEIGAPLVSEDEQSKLLANLDGWIIDRSENPKLVNEYRFKSYADASRFVTLIVNLAESEDHHPKITLEWGLVILEWWSHKIKGLHINDFICATKSDKIFRLL
jgi:4a-hydroxytetrahydrobiopterin dehydratase|tara:strand:- start:174 stop:515 length:342 start_codon:yes stop_codon:yes gene_type:complete